MAVQLMLPHGEAYTHFTVLTYRYAENAALEIQ